MNHELIENMLLKLTGSEFSEFTPFSERLNARRLLWLFAPDADGNEVSLLKEIVKIENANRNYKIFVKLLGDPSYFDTHGTFHKRPQYYEFDSRNLQSYYENNEIQYAARMIFSTSLDWFLLISFEMYALLGATSELMTEIESTVPKLAQYYNTEDFLEYWESCKEKNGVDISWTKELLLHIQKPK